MFSEKSYKNMFPCHFCFVKLCLDRIRYVCSIRMHKSMFFRNHRHTSLGECASFFCGLMHIFFQKTFYHNDHIIDGLNSHIHFKHKKTGKLCDTCKKDFKDTYALNRHMKKHSDERYKESHGIM
jgi:hypothetical protein